MRVLQGPNSVRRFRRSVQILLLAAMVLPGQVHAQDLADKLRAAFLYNFAKFVTWPASRLNTAEQSIRLCVLGDASFAGLLSATVGGKTAGSHPLEVVDAQQPEQLSGCHIAYFPDLSEDRQSIMAQQQAQQVLTVHQESAVNAAGVVRFYLEDRRIRLEINNRAAEAADLKISAKLLALARVVQG